MIKTLEFVVDETLKLHNIKVLEEDYLYDISELNLYTEGFNGRVKIIGSIRKRDYKTIVKFKNIQDPLICSTRHLLLDSNSIVKKVAELVSGDELYNKKIIDSIEYTEEVQDLYDIAVDAEDHLFKTPDGIVHHNTTVVEKTLHDMGLEDGDGYFQVSGGSVSPITAFKTLFNNRTEIVLFDDSDSMLRKEDGRNLIKTATDTKKRRKISWSTQSSSVYDPDKVSPPEEEIGVSQFPKYFDFEGRIIFISNLTLEELDPDGSIRTRAWLIKIDPSDDEMLSHMQEILDKIKLNDGLELDHATRMKVFNIVKNSPNKEDVNVRKLVRSMNFAATGIPGWEELVHLYA